jgi:ParB-like chromosome segregation protein Spo0J
MATALNVGIEKAKRGDLFLVDPNEVIIEESWRGREFPPTEEEIIQLATNIFYETQLSPVEARRLPDNRPKLTLGFTRTAAVRLIRKGFPHPETGELLHDPQRLLKLIVVDGNDEEAFRRNIIENAHRKATSPIDDAHNQRKLKDNYGNTDQQIATLYGLKSTNMIIRNRKLLALDRNKQRMVHEGKMSVEAALMLLELPEEKREEAVKTATEDTGKVAGTKLRVFAREAAIDAADEQTEDEVTKALHVTQDILRDDHKELRVGTATTAPKPRYQKLTGKEMVRFFQEKLDDEDTPQPLRNLAETFMTWASGRRKVAWFEQQLNDMLPKRAKK